MGVSDGDLYRHREDITAKNNPGPQPLQIPIKAFQLSAWEDRGFIIVPWHPHKRDPRTAGPPTGLTS